MAGGAANLYPELLLALVGHTGDVFVQREQRIALADTVDWVSPPERCVSLHAAGRGAACGSHTQPPSLQPASCPLHTHKTGSS